MAQQQGGRTPQNSPQNYRSAPQYGPSGQAPNSAGGGLTPEQRRVRQRRRQEQMDRKLSRRRAVFSVLLLLIVVASFLVIKLVNGGLDDVAQVELDAMDLGDLDDEAEEALYNGPPVATIAFVGDISVSADQVAAATKADGTYDFTLPLSDVKDHVSGAAYAVGDFETNMVEELAYGGEPYYNAPVQLAGSLRALGFRLMSTANTYALNNGIEGLISTKSKLAEAGLRSVGTYLNQEERDLNGGAYIRNIHKIRFAFLSYTKGTDSVSMPAGCEYALNTLYSDYADYWTELRSSQIRQDVQAARDAGAEVIIALVHWGSEYGRTLREPQKQAAELLLDSGVDVIIGTHSHLVGEMGFQEVEQANGTVKNCFVAYGLGDFYTDPAQENGQQSVILKLEFSREDDGSVSITKAEYVPIYMYITETGGKRQFMVLDVYKNLASLKRSSMTADEMELFNQLYDTVETLHTYAGEELDAGPNEADQRIITRVLEEGPVSDYTIKSTRKEEQAAQKAAESGSAEDNE